jgi:hypothetical protein
MSLREERSRGVKARKEYEELEAAFAKLRGAVLERVVTIHPQNQRELDRLICTVQTLDAVKQALLHIAAGGEMAEAMLAINPEL